MFLIECVALLLVLVACGVSRGRQAERDRLDRRLEELKNDK